MMSTNKEGASLQRGPSKKHISIDGDLSAPDYLYMYVSVQYLYVIVNYKLRFHNLRDVNPFQ